MVSFKPMRKLPCYEFIARSVVVEPVLPAGIVCPPALNRPPMLQAYLPCFVGLMDDPWYEPLGIVDKQSAAS